jgi:hypothetical protein
LLTGGARALLGKACGDWRLAADPAREDLPLIQGDRVQLQEEMLNLIVNAVQANVRSERVARVADRLCASFCYATMCHTARLGFVAHVYPISIH